MASIISAGTTSGTALNVSADTTGDLAFQTKAGANTITVPNLTGTLLTNKTAGTVLQVVQATTTTYVTANSTTYVDTTLSASITPSSTSNKVLVLINQAIGTSGAGNVGGIRLVRNSTDVQTWGFGVFYTGSSDLYGYSSNNYLDSPSSTSSVTYKTQINRQGGSGTTRVQYSDSNGSQISTITLLEIAA